jgi:hypothetical protein
MTIDRPLSDRRVTSDGDDVVGEGRPGVPGLAHPRFRYRFTRLLAAHR